MTIVAELGKKSTGDLQAGYPVICKSLIPKVPAKRFVFMVENLSQESVSDQVADGRNYCREDSTP